MTRFFLAPFSICCSPTLTSALPIGRRTSMCDAAGWEAWSYDSRGHVITERRNTNSVTKSTAYTYNFHGGVTSITYPSGRTVTYTYNSAGQTGSASDVANSITYASNAHYNPAGALATLQESGSNIISTMYYNNRLQPCRVSVKSSGTAPSSCTDATYTGNLMDFTYGFNSGSANNGNVASITNNINTARSQTYTYDELNRIVTAQTTATSGTHSWGLAFTYDPWANLLSASVTQGSAYSFSVYADGANRIHNTGGAFTYDAAGNLTADPINSSYTYNAEGELTSAAGVTYTYDGDGNRVKKSSGKLYWYGLGTDPLSESDGSGNLTEEYIFVAGKRIAMLTLSSGAVNYYLSDHLGSSHVVTNSSGTILDDSDFYPFGGERSYSSSSGNNYKFTGKERDTESGLDDFAARFYTSNYGRFLSPDDAKYVKSADPQTWNLYGYVANNPVNSVDPTGHAPEYMLPHRPYMRADGGGGATAADGETAGLEGGGGPSASPDDGNGTNTGYDYKNLDAAQTNAFKEYINSSIHPSDIDQNDDSFYQEEWGQLSGGQQTNFAAITQAMEKTKLSDGSSALSQIKSITSIGGESIDVAWKEGAQAAFKASGFVERPGLHPGETGMIGKPDGKGGIKGGYTQAQGMHVLFNDANKGATGDVHIDYRSGPRHYFAGNSDVRSVVPGAWNNYEIYKGWYGPMSGYNP